MPYSNISSIAILCIYNLLFFHIWSEAGATVYYTFHNLVKTFPHNNLSGTFLSRILMIAAEKIVNSGSRCIKEVERCDL